MAASRMLAVRVPEADYAALELLVQAQRAAGHDVTFSKVVQRHIGNLADTIRREMNGTERESS